MVLADIVAALDLSYFRAEVARGSNNWRGVVAWKWQHEGSEYGDLHFVSARDQAELLDAVREIIPIISAFQQQILTGNLL